MKKVFHKNQVIITTLAVLIAVAGYISYDRVNGGKADAAKEANATPQNEYIVDNSSHDIFTDEEGTETAEILDPQNETLDPGGAEEILNPGETVLTGSMGVNTDYAASVKLNREQVRSKNKETLQAIIDSAQVNEQQKQEALDQMVAMTDIAEKEAAAEMLLEAKGFTNVVVSIQNEGCDVVLNMGDVTDAKRAQVEDIVKRKTGIKADKIVITTLSE